MTDTLCKTALSSSTCFCVHVLFSSSWLSLCLCFIFGGCCRINNHPNLKFRYLDFNQITYLCPYEYRFSRMAGCIVIYTLLPSSNFKAISFDIGVLIKACLEYLSTAVCQLCTRMANYLNKMSLFVPYSHSDLPESF